MLRFSEKGRKYWRICGYLFFAFTVTATVLAVTFLAAARAAQPRFRPITEPLPPGLSARIDQIPGYRRDEDATYLTFVEWYLVFNPQEYAQFIEKNPPSRFPYFCGIRQIWSSYVDVYGIARRYYRFNAGYNLMLVVIGTSSTVEFAIKGTYEKTVGRIFEWSASGESTSEDRFAAKVARAYGEFIPTRPWFEFPFGHELVELWSTTGFFGRHFPRKCERKFFLSVEYGVKSIYAAVIRLASRAIFGIADTEIYLSARGVSDLSLHRPHVRRVQQLGNGHWILAVPHYQGFTDTIPVLARDGLEFDEIAGNDEMLLTVVAPAGWSYNLTAGQPLFTMPLLTGESQRIAVQVPIKSLSHVLREIDAKHLRLEHLFDF